jgi:Cys-rich repeat protein
VYDPYTGTGLVCAYDNECPAGYICDRSIDACVEGCRSDAHCAWNEYCDSYTKLCYEIPGCTDDLDCPAGNYCDIDGSCVLYEEHEVVVEEAGCLSDADCPAGTYCESDGYCWGYDYARCEGDWDCYNGEYCAQDGYCAKVEPLCASSVDCPMDTICRGGVCVVPEEIYYCWNDLECPPGTNKCVFHGVCPPGEVDCMGICEP